jgi:hypothetical protein
VLLGTDIVYERSLLPALCSVIRAFLVSSHAATAAAYIACTERSYTTIDCFHEQLKKCGLVFEVMIAAGSFIFMFHSIPN